ncbi:hypothetical protein K6119_01825 [Paracrocinitomix mangrovi]|uniref:DUF7793 family protein n=1 Tax=Paracrocinitomix mangrovi TaxID=2862509 RepID=UPI001C8E58D7|nr:hypothetical protein [Paracrocinitomix mangrovi]UKN02256.1 hypothetical protein K6119_01825 [Paracrocinitomix mangrovi]
MDSFDAPTIINHIRNSIEDCITLEKVDYYFADNGITYIVFKKHNQIELSDSLKEYEKLKKRSEIFPLSLILLIEPLVTVSSEVINFWTYGEGSKLIKSEAIVSNDLGLKISMIPVNRELDNIPFALKIFDSIEAAEKWTLHQLI